MSRVVMQCHTLAGTEPEPAPGQPRTIRVDRNPYVAEQFRQLLFQTLSLQVVQPLLGGRIEMLEQVPEGDFFAYEARARLGCNRKIPGRGGTHGYWP